MLREKMKIFEKKMKLIEEKPMLFELRIEDI
jgi:hypothetical protein